MSITWSLVCDETRKTLWIGQGYGEMNVLYSGDPKVMRDLKAFLNDHRGKSFRLISDCEMEGTEVEQYEEYKKE